MHIENSDFEITNLHCFVAPGYIQSVLEVIDTSLLDMYTTSGKKRKRFDHKLQRSCCWSPSPYVWVLISRCREAQTKGSFSSTRNILYAAQSLLHRLRGLV